MKWRPGDPIDLWIILPKGVMKPPAVLYLYGDDQDTDRFKLDGWAARVTSGGVGAVGFVSALSGHRFHDRPMKQWFVSELQESIGSTVHDAKLILDYLAQRGDIDMDRIGMFGEGSGGTIAILAAAADPRIKAVDALEPWGDWPDFLAKSSRVQDDPERAEYVKLEFLKKVAPLDPVKWLPDLKIPIECCRCGRILPLRSSASKASKPPPRNRLTACASKPYPTSPAERARGSCSCGSKPTCSDRASRTCPAEFRSRMAIPRRTETILRGRDFSILKPYVVSAAQSRSFSQGGFGGYERAFQSMCPVRVSVPVLAGRKLLKFQLARWWWTERAAIHVTNRDHYDRSWSASERYGERNRHLESGECLWKGHARRYFESGNSNHGRLCCSNSGFVAAALPQQPDLSGCDCSDGLREPVRGTSRS